MTEHEAAKWQFVKWDEVLGPKFIGPDGQQWSMGSGRNANTSGYQLADYLNVLESDNAALMQRCEELAKQYVDVAELQLADEQSVRNLEQQVEALKAERDRLFLISCRSRRSQSSSSRAGANKSTSEGRASRPNVPHQDGRGD